MNRNMNFDSSLASIHFWIFDFLSSIDYDDILNLESTIPDLQEFKSLTDFRIGFFEGLSVFIAISIQDLLFNAELYGFSFSKSDYNISYQWSGLRGIKTDTVLSKFIYSIYYLLTDFETNTSINLDIFINNIKNHFRPIKDNLKDKFIIVDENGNKLDNKKILKDWKVSKISHYILDHEEAGYFIDLLWGREDNEKITPEERRMTIFTRRFPKLTNHPNAKKINFLGYKLVVLLSLSFITGEKVKNFFNSNHKYHFITELQSWEPDTTEIEQNFFNFDYDDGVDIPDLFSTRNKIMDILDFSNSFIHYEVKAINSIDIPDVPQLDNPNYKLTLEEVFDNRPSESSKFLSLKSSALFKLIADGLCANMDEEDIEIIMFYHSDNFETVIPLTSKPDTDLEYKVSLAIFIPIGINILTNASRWITFQNIAYFIPGDDLQTKSFVEIINYLDHLKARKMIYGCKFSELENYSKSLDRKRIEKSHKETLKSRSVLRGLIGEFISNTIFSNYFHYIKIHFKFNQSDLDLIGIYSKKDLIEINVFEIKEISMAGIINKKEIKKFVDKISTITLEDIIDRVYPFLKNKKAKIKLKFAFMTLRLFDYEEHPFRKLKKSEITEDGIEEYIKSLTDYDIDHFNSENFFQLVHHTGNDNLLKVLKSSWEKLNWLEDHHFFE